MTERYRTEIDGLRALAASLVTLFHFFPDTLSEGYLGVDLFFVISGYVITMQLQAQMRPAQGAPSFSFAAFYARRIRRILPLSFLVVAVTVAAGYVLLLGPDFDRLMQSAWATITFWANIFFWRDGGYFGGADKLKPLLHMWSLAVEEQFYILFPALFWLLMAKLRLRMIWVITALAVLTGVSLLAWIGLRQIGGAVPAFFLMPTRAWQFGAGALVALLMAQGWRRDSALVSGGALAVLVLALVVPVPLIPGEAVVTLAAALYLLCTRGGFALDRLLSTPVMRYLGARSFSIYLWHWPIVAYLGYAFVTGIPLVWTLAGLVLTLVLSEGSYRLVERPFRYRFGLPASLGLIAACCALAVGLTGLAATRSATSLPDRLAAEIQTNYRCALSDFVPYGASRACVLKPLAETGNIAILGNSHAQMYAGNLTAQLASAEAGVVLVPLNGCPPTSMLNTSRRCAARAAANLEAVMQDRSISSVVIGTTYARDHWVRADGTAVEDPQGQAFAEALLALVAELETRKEAVYLVGPIQTPGYDLPSELARQIRFGQLSPEAAEAALRVPAEVFETRYGALIARLEAALGPRLLRPDQHLCDTKGCAFADAQGSFFADSNHLGRHGVEKIATIFAPVTEAQQVGLSKGDDGR